MLFSGTESENLPSMSVVVPVVVPFSTTEAPGNGDPSSPEVITPLITLSWP